MIRTRTATSGALIFMMLMTALAAEPSNLLVDSYGKLVLISTSGTDRVLAASVILASLSPDGETVAFTQDEDPPALPAPSQALYITSIRGGASRRIAALPRGAHFGSLGWMPDGSNIVFEGKDSHLFITAASENGEPRDLGPWYQGFSIAADGRQIVHAVNSPAMGLEIMDVASGRRRLLHTTSRVVWSAKFSPDGQWIAYQMTLGDPAPAKDDEPDCTPPTIGLRIYSVKTGRDMPVRIDVPKGWDNVKSFVWSPDSKRLALTLGTTDCDYPGSADGVFVTAIDQQSQARVSEGDMSFEPAFSPDGSAVAYVDFSESVARIFRFDFATQTRTLIRRATATDNYYRLLEWR